MAFQKGLRLVDREAGVAGLGDVESADPEAYYTFYDDLLADRLERLKETHMITGSVGVRNGRLLITVWVTEVATAEVVVRTQGEGAFEGAVDLLERVVDALVDDLSRAGVESERS